MKWFQILISCLFYLFSQNLSSQVVEKTALAQLSQDALREKKNIQVSFFLKENVYAMNIAYNINSKFSIGGYLGESHIKTHEFDIFLDSFYYKNKENLNVRGAVYLRYFILNFPIFFSAQAGRDLYGSSKKNMFIGYVDRNNQFNPGATSYTLDIAPYYYTSIGLGVQWVFQNGFFVSWEIANRYSMSGSQNVNVYNDERSYLFPGSAFSVSQLLIEKNIINTVENGRIKNSSIYREIWIGYSFEM